MNSVWSILELRRLIYSFDSTYHEIYRECLHAIQKNGLYKTLWFTDGHGNNVDYKIMPCIKNNRNQCKCWSHGNHDCKGELIVQASGHDIMLHLSNGSYHVMEDGWVSSFGSDAEHTYSCFDLNEFDWSLQRKLQA